jgi:hypothetical protein
MMRFELGLEAPDPKRALRSALTIAGSYVVGGMIPLLPYMLAANAHQALVVSNRRHSGGARAIRVCEGPLHGRLEV